jgi:membrane protein DedA with SNARE-associated domain
LDSLAGWLQRRGARGVAVARATPGLRVGAIAAAGLAALGFPSFLAGLVVGNAVFVGGHFALGLLVGPAAVGLVAGGGSVAVLAAAIVALAALGAVGWSMLRRRRATAGLEAAPLSEDTSAYGAWADAACPACLAIALVRPGGLGEPRV